MAEHLFSVPQTIGVVLCCKCGIAMCPNPANMCVTCLRSEVDITEGLKKQFTASYCPDCESYLQPITGIWIKAQLELKELFSYCVTRVNKNVEKAVRLVDAKFVWTEPHSKRLKLRLRVQKEVLNGAILEQSYLVEFVVQDHLCESCSRVHANPDQWVSNVQLRQHVSNRRTFFYLEQVILKHGAAAHAIRIKQMHRGIDFFFAKRSDGMKFVEFLGKVAPVRSRHDKQLVSHDTKSNNYNYRYTFSVEISPVCREDLIFLPRIVSKDMGNLGPLVICTKVTNAIAILDPFTLRQCFLDAGKYFRAPFESLLTSRQLVKYYVHRVSKVPDTEGSGSNYVLADVEVSRASDRDMKFWVRTHLGHILKAGSYALGYDLRGANSNNGDLEEYMTKGRVLPDAILIKKCYEDEIKRGKPRPWKLMSLDAEVDVSIAKAVNYQEIMSIEYEEFLRDLEENPELRFNISLYRNRSETAPMYEGDDHDRSCVPLQEEELKEMFGDLRLSDSEDGQDSMME